jgi:hypothetical protein
MDAREERERQTPLAKVRGHLDACPDDRQPVVLLTTGSLCPVHLMHVRVLEEAREHVAAAWTSVCVVGAFLSPSHDSYVGSKMRSSGNTAFHFSFEERAAMCDLATADSSFVAVDRWEGLQRDFVDFPDVYRIMQTWFDWLHESGRLRRRVQVQ